MSQNTKTGCAVKVAATELNEILRQVRFPPKTKDILVDGDLMDDAGVIQITEDLAIIQTLDFFTQIVEDHYSFGKIAAANALSDVYAMGGVPKSCMAILAFPVGFLDNKAVAQLLQGASDVIAEAKAVMIGGHTIDDETLKFGLSVTGYVHPQKIWTNAGAKPGDILILTKPLGAGTIMTALKREVISLEEAGEVVESMAMLNNAVDLLDKDLHAAIHAATDITGFGLSGHAMQMAKASQCTFKINFAKLPLFALAERCLSEGFLTKAHRANAEYTKDSIQWGNLSSLQKLVMHDPQTSGGLLLSVAPSEAPSVLRELHNKFLRAEIIGEVQSFSGALLEVEA